MRKTIALALHFVIGAGFGAANWLVPEFSPLGGKHTSGIVCICFWFVPFMALLPSFDGWRIAKQCAYAFVFSFSLPGPHSINAFTILIRSVALALCGRAFYDLNREAAAPKQGNRLDEGG